MLLAMPDQHSLPDDKDALRAMVVALQAQSDSLQSENLSYEKALQIERAKNDALDRHIATFVRTTTRRVASSPLRQTIRTTGSTHLSAGTDARRSGGKCQ